MRKKFLNFSHDRYANDDGFGSKGILFSSGNEWREQRRFAIKNLKGVIYKLQIKGPRKSVPLRKLLFLDFGFGKTSMESMIAHEVAKLCDYLKQELNQPVSLGIGSARVLKHLKPRSRLY
jgi:hypothetical protein